MTRMVVLLASGAALFVALAGDVASAAPVWLECRASGAAGTVAFRLGFDEATNQASTSWSAGGGRPARAHFGETGTDVSQSVSITMTSISALFQTSTIDDPYMYRANINRTDGSLSFFRFDRSVRTSTGSCSPAAAPQRQF